MVARSNLGVDRVLTQFAQFKRNQMSAFVADRVLPPVQVNGQTGKFYTISNGFGFASPGFGINRGSGASFQRLDMSISQTSAYTLKESGLEAPVDDVDASIAADDGLALREAASELALHYTMIERERDCFDNLAFNASVITQTSALSGADRWDTDTSDPRDQVHLAAETVEQAIGVPQELLTMVLNPQGARALMKNAALLQFFRSAAPGTTMLNVQQLAIALGVKDVIIASAVENSAKEGQTASKGYIAGKSALFCYIDQNPTALRPQGLGVTFQKRGRPQGQIERYREEPRNEIVLSSFMEDRVVVNAEAGYLFTTVVS
jgi:hypothetical protein